jgi:uncharacterized protein YjbJ (UPF0337 family)
MLEWSRRISEASRENDTAHTGRVVMDKDRIAGSAKEIKGSVKETIGKATGDAKLQTDGTAKKVEGKVQNAIGGAKDAARDALKK